jgi:hypothetical protein
MNMYSTTAELGPIYETFIHANKLDSKGRHIGYVVGLRDNGTDFYAWVQNARYVGNGEWVEFGVQQRSRRFDSLQAANAWAYATARERIAA